MKKKIVDIAHDFLEPILNEESIAVDFTCGQGFDTLFLAKHSRKTFAFDIQEKAIQQTKTRCEEAGIGNVEVILDSHINIKQYIKHFHVGIFNCGYLPHGEKNVTTHGEEVLRAIHESLDVIEKDGRIVVVLYPGFENGKQESCMIENETRKLSSKYYDVMKFQLTNRNEAPYLIIIDKHE